MKTEIEAAPQASSSVPTRGWAIWGTASCLYAVVAVVAFYAAYASAKASLLVGVYLFALVQLAHASSARKAFYLGFLVGLAIAAGKLAFFWRIFAGGALALWGVYAFWIGLFVLLTRSCLRAFPTQIAAALIPLLWCGLEYFRSELYYLRFSWLTPALAFAPPEAPLHLLGSYGTGLLLAAIGCGSALAWRRSINAGLIVLLGGLAAFRGIAWASEPKLTGSAQHELRVAGVQLEFPNTPEIIIWLNAVIRRYPDAQLIVMSEYTLQDHVPAEIKEWCRRNRRFLIIGGKDAAPVSYYNTAFVISSSGEIVFKQAKSVPIQFFDDGLPAPSQNTWKSPWGDMGICICYDLSYRRITDALVRKGAQILVVPTMDVTGWGEQEHRLHSRVGPLRAAEYHLPIFRLASSGISQAIAPSGTVLASAPYPGQGAMLFASLPLHKPAGLPLDQWLAPISTIATLAISILLGILAYRRPENRTTAQLC